MNTLPAVAAHVVSVSGDAWFQDGAERLPLLPGTGLAAGQLVHTGSHGTALLQLASGHELGLGPEQNLLLDADVLANSNADTSEWALGARANPAMVAEWLAPESSPLNLAAVLDAPGDSLDHLLNTSAVTAPDHAPMHQLLMAGMGDDGLTCLLRSLYGPESG